MKLLVVDNKEVLSELDYLEVQGYLDCDLVLKTENDLIKYVDEFNDVEAILLISIDESSNLDDVADAFEGKDIKIISSDKIKVGDKFGTIQELRPLNIVDTISKELGINQSKSTFCKISKETLLSLTPNECNIFVKLSESKYVKILSSDGGIDSSVLDRYINKGVNSFYVPNKDFLKYLEELSLKLQVLKKKEPLYIEDTHFMNLNMLEGVHNKIRSVGVDDKVIEEVSLVVETTVKSLRSEESLFKKLFSVLTKSRELYEHCLLINYIGSSLALKLGWNSDSSLEKIVLASLFHDISLDNEELALKEHLPIEEVEKLSWREIKAIKEHPLSGAEIVKRVKNLPPDVDSIILSHHEKPDGSGFPRGLDATQTSQICCLFNIVEDFVWRIYPTEELSSEFLNKCIDDMKELYNRGNYKRVFTVFSEMIKFSKL